MKFKKLLIIPLGACLLLSSCRPIYNFFSYIVNDPSEEDLSAPINSTRILVYNAVDANSKFKKNKNYVPNYSDVYLKAVNVMFYDDAHRVPYISFNEFAELQKKLITSGKIKLTVTEQRTTFQFKKGDTTYFEVIDKYDKGAFYLMGDMSGSTITSNEAYDSSLKLGYEYISYDTYDTPADQHKEMSYEEAGYEIHVEDGVRYYPLSLLNITFSDYTDLNLFYNYDGIYVYDDYDYFKNNFKYRSGLSTLRPYNAFYQIAHNSSNPMSDEVKADRLASYQYFLNSVYGLKYTWGWDKEDMDSFLDSFSFTTKMMDDNPLARQQALTDLKTHLDDAHTSISASPWEKGVSYTGTRGPKISNMILEGQNINSIRTAANLPAISYSSDGSTALFVLDSFNNISTNYKYASVEQLAKEDDFFFMAHTLNTIKNKGGVQNIIIDITTNGGGYVASMLKILALLSSDNTGSCSFYAENTKDYEVDVVRVDSNLDGQYNLDDVYGDDFNFYIMSSAYSFSCANSFPFLAQKSNYAIIIGSNSGGGECVVVPTTMPTGEEVYHSSYLHIGYYDIDNKVWYGNECGAYVEEKYRIAYDDTRRYDIEFLKQLISQ